MDSSPILHLSRHLIASAVQRCRLSQALCRLSITLKSASPHLPSSLRFSVSDTGVASSLDEFRGFKCFQSLDRRSLEQCDAILSIKTTGTEDKEVYIYCLDLKDNISDSGVKQMPSLPKKGLKFSGTEASFVANVDVEETASWLTCFFQKMLIARFPKIVLEMVLDLDLAASSKSHYLVHPSEDISVMNTVPCLEALASGFQDYVLQHKFAHIEHCRSSPVNREILKIGCGAAINLGGLRSGQTLEAVILLMDISALPSNSSCLRSFDEKTEVMYFEEFMPCAIPYKCLDALTNVNWKNYNFSLKTSSRNVDGSAIIEWDKKPKHHRIDIILHSYSDKVLVLHDSGHDVNKNLVKRSMKAALDDLKEKHTNCFLSEHASKIYKHAPDLSRTIEGLILSSDDVQFQEECLLILGLQTHDLAEEGKVESCIKEKIQNVIEMKDLRPKTGRETKALLFNDNLVDELEEYHDLENESESEQMSVELG